MRAGSARREAARRRAPARPASFVFPSHQLGSFTGVWLAGYLFEATGPYDLVWWISVALGLAAALLPWPIDERRVAPAAA